VARGFARIFLQNSVNLGLNLVTVPDVEAAEGDELEVESGTLVNRTSGRTFAIVPLPKPRQAIVDAGGLIAYTRKRVREAAGRA
jgi:3-isopropylmalate/(R)-2-methylmalate dehydratase small subunit